MHLVLVEGVEPVLHRAESKRIKGQAREVFGRVSDKVWTSASPFHGQLLGDVMHIVEHIADRQRTEGWDENPMCDHPLVSARMGGEEPISGPISDLLQDRMYVL